MKENSFICDYYVCNNKKSEFIFIAVNDVKAFSLQKNFLLHNIFVKYPQIAKEMIALSAKRYKKNVKLRLIKHREEHLEEINNKSSYKMITVKEKANLESEAAEEQKAEGEIKKLGRHDTDLNSILKKRIESIQSEMTKFSENIGEFALTCDLELNNLIGNINLL